MAPIGQQPHHKWVYFSNATRSYLTSRDTSVSVDLASLTELLSVIMLLQHVPKNPVQYNTPHVSPSPRAVSFIILDLIDVIFGVCAPANNVPLSALSSCISHFIIIIHNKMRIKYSGSALHAAGAVHNNTTAVSSKRPSLPDIGTPSLLGCAAFGPSANSNTDCCSGSCPDERECSCKIIIGVKRVWSRPKTVRCGVRSKFDFELDIFLPKVPKQNECNQFGTFYFRPMLLVIFPSVS